MVPVRLQLKNFLSYGESAPALDFESFHVACLSGKNGQGKSALLDAMTWALWGEARKVQGAVKPDENLIRVGTRQMEVEFTFDIEGDRYRVVRGYRVSETGKTNKSTLEFQIFDAETDSYRPLTQGHLRDTQQSITNVLGIDYETFVNSAFLLQGRSDSFTRMGARDRKAILTRILNLGRYDRLVDMARARLRTAEHTYEMADAGVQRLSEAVQDEPALKQELASTEEDLSRLDGQAETLDEQYAALVQQLAELRAKATRVDEAENALAELNERRDHAVARAGKLTAQIDAAQAILSQRAQIRADAERLDELELERSRLETNAELARGLDSQLTRVERELAAWQRTLNTRIVNLEAERKGNERTLEENARKQSRAAEIRSGLEASRQAADEAARLQGMRRRQDELQAEVRQLGADIEKAKALLIVEGKQAKQQVVEVTERLERLDGQQDELKALRAKVDTLGALRDRRDDLRASVQTLREEISGREATRGQRERERDDLIDQGKRLKTTEHEVCPTCGTELTDEHREHVLAGYRERARAVIQQVKLDDQWLGEHNTTLDALQQSLAGLDAEIQAGTEAEQQLIRLEAELGKREELAQQLSEATARRNELAGQLRSNAYAPALHQRLNEAEEHLSSIDFDPAALDEAQRTAAFKDRWEREARELRHVENEIERLTPLIERQQRELAAARDQLDAGHPQLTEQRRRLEAQRAEIGYDGERHAAVRNAIRELETVRARVTQLLGAEETIERALAERMSAQQEEAQLSSRIEKGQTMLAELRVQIESLGEAETRTQEMAEQKAALDEQRSELQTQIGTVQAKLNQRAEEKKELANQRARKKEASHEKRLYRNLRTAFGKNGIPSLIIEQTLPEVEDRTNELLAGLSGNTARVKLETLKDKKSGGTKETLELRITDAQGVSRPYETFSGGEAFRVNFALRLALSQLLAERSGVRIRTLVIDEGFGTQDQEGVQNLVDAIQAIQSDFDKIIVITHLNELKEAFPVRIEVEKHPVTGSQCEVVAA